jgi:hypothetical protein
MKKTLSILFMLSTGNSYCATGNASDGELLAVLVLAFIALILGTGYFIDYLKRVIRTAITKKWFLKKKSDKNLTHSFEDGNRTISPIFNS